MCGVEFGAYRDLPCIPWKLTPGKVQDLGFKPGLDPDKLHCKLTLRISRLQIVLHGFQPNTWMNGIYNMDTFRESFLSRHALLGRHLDLPRLCHSNILQCSGLRI